MVEFIKEHWITLACFPVVIYFQLIVHELSHAAAAKLWFGYRITRLRLYPVKWGDFARCEWVEENNRPTLIDRIESKIRGRKVEIKISKFWLYWAPMWGGLLSLTLATWLLIMFDNDVLFWMMAIAATVDLHGLWLGAWIGSENCDGKKARQARKEELKYAE